MNKNQTVQKCYNCGADAPNSVYVGNRIRRYCDEHLNNVIYQFANEGLEPLMDFLNANCDAENMKRIGEIFYSEDAVENYIKSLDELMPMFTYGILKYPDNIVREGGVNIHTQAKVKGHIMYATNGRSFPVTKITGNEKDVIYGTYFEVPRSVVRGSYDLTEGYEPSSPPEYNMYNRQIVQVTLPNGEVKDANMYIANPSFFTESMVPAFQIMTGNYDDKHTQMRLILDGIQFGEG